MQDFALLERMGEIPLPWLAENLLIPLHLEKFDEMFYQIKCYSGIKDSKTVK